MTFRDFGYWLRGYLELENPNTINEEQLSEIKRHLDICFNIEKHQIMQDYDIPIPLGIFGYRDFKFDKFQEEMSKERGQKIIAVYEHNISC